MGVKLTPQEKQNELIKHKAIIIAAIDYLKEKYSIENIGGMNPGYLFESLKPQVEEDFAKGRLSKMKQWLHDITDEPREIQDKNFDVYVKAKTGYDYDVAGIFQKTIDKIIKNKKIKTEDEYRDVMVLIDKLCHTAPVDKAQIDKLNQLILDFEKA